MVYKMKESLYIDFETKIIYKKIQNECSDSRPSYLDIFKLAMAVGYAQSVRTPLLKRHRFIRLSSAGEDFDSLISLIIIDELGNDFQELVDNPSKIYEIAEEYANTGIRVLNDRFNGEYDYYSILEKELFNLYEGYNLLEALNNLE